MILYTIFSEISIISACRYESMEAAITTELRLLEIFFTGYGIATGVNFLIFPLNCRTIAYSQFGAYMGGLENVMKEELRYLSDMEKSLIKQKDHAPMEQGDLMTRTVSTLRPRLTKTWTRIDEELLAKSVASAMKAVGDTHGKLSENLIFAQFEAAWGKLDPKDLKVFADKLRAVGRPVNGLGTLTVIFEKLNQWREGLVEGDAVGQQPIFPESKVGMASRAAAPDRDDWATIFQVLQPSTQLVMDEMNDGFEHVSLLLSKANKSFLGTTRTRVKNRDLEKKPEDPMPGDEGFAEAFEKRVAKFHATRGETLKRWTQAQGLNLATFRADQPNLHDREREQIFILLFIQNVWHGISDAVLDLVQFADSRLAEGPMSKDHFVVPGRRKLYKWLKSSFLDVQGSSTDPGEPESSESNVHSIPNSLPMQRNAPHHPEHLPPKNRWQRVGARLRTAGQFFGSKQSEFGFRVALAVLSVAMLALLRQSQSFFFDQKVIWAMIIIAYCMVPTSGSSIFNLVARVTATAVAIVVAIVNWYIVGGNTAGVLVFLYVFNCFEYYLMGRFPFYTGVFIVTLQTRNIITGYETQVTKLGVERFVTLSQQAYYPVYLIGPHRLAAVSAGCFVAFFWTVFPYPVTARSTLRKKLGQCLFLCANYYTAMHATRDMWMAGKMGDMNDKHSPGRRLTKARRKVHAKLLTLLTSLRTHSAFTKYEPSIGGDFPKHVYDEIIREIESLLNYMTLVSYATQSVRAESTEWLQDLGIYLHSKDSTAHSLTSLLSLLAASVMNAQPLPPFLAVPKPYHLAVHMQDRDLVRLHLEHAEEPGYSAFATMEVASILIGDGVGRLVEYVRELVGEVTYASSLYVHPDGVTGHSKDRKVE